MPEESLMEIRLSPAALEAVKDIMRLGGFESVQEAIRQAIADERFFLKERRNGSTVLLNKDGKYLEVEFAR